MTSEPPAAADHPRRTWVRRLWPWPAAAALFVFALTVRLQFQAHVEYTPYKDAVAYHKVARRLVDEGIYSEPPWRAYRLPGYPGFLAGIYRWTGPNPRAAHRVQAVLDSVACVGLAWLGAGMFGRSVGVLTGVIAAFHKVLIEMTTELMTESLFYPVSVGLLCCLWAARSRSRWRYPIAAGVCGAILQVTRTQLSVAWPCLLLWCWFAWRPAWPDWRRRLAAVMLVVALAATLPGAWSLRNGLLFDGRYTGLATISWPNLYWGNVGIDALWELHREYKTMPWPEGELGLAARCREELFARIAADPPAYVEFVVRRLRWNIPRFFYWRELYEPHIWFQYQAPWMLSVRHLGLLTLLGAGLCWRSRVAGALLFLYALPQMSLYLLLSNAGHRFNWTFSGIYCLLTAVALVAAARLGLRTVRRTRPAPGSAV